MEEDKNIVDTQGEEEIIEEETFWQKHKKKIKIGCGVVITAICGYFFDLISGI